MVEEWNIGDEFEVILDQRGRYLNKGDKGKCWGVTPLGNSGGEPSIYFTENQNQSIYIYRIKKITKEPTYELW